ncbi:MAG: hypothetical protein V3V01_19910, partial [Acidimicrobiales bacterium]
TCRREAPAVAEVTASYAGEVTILGVAGRDNIEASQAFVTELGVEKIDHLFDDADVWSRFGVTSQPSWAFINDDGTIDVKFGRLGADGLMTAIADLEAR